MTFVFKFKRLHRLFWRRREVSGYQFKPDVDRMILYFDDGAIEEIAKWSDCHVKLGTDWVLAMKSKMEKEAGASVPVNVKG